MRRGSPPPELEKKAYVKIMYTIGFGSLRRRGNGEGPACRTRPVVVVFVVAGASCGRCMSTRRIGSVFLLFFPSCFFGCWSAGRGGRGRRRKISGRHDRFGFCFTSWWLCCFRGNGRGFRGGGGGRGVVVSSINSVVARGWLQIEKGGGSKGGGGERGANVFQDLRFFCFVWHGHRPTVRTE